MQPPALRDSDILYLVKCVLRITALIMLLMVFYLVTDVKTFFHCETMNITWYFENRLLLFLVNLNYTARLDYYDVKRSHSSFS